MMQNPSSEKISRRAFLGAAVAGAAVPFTAKAAIPGVPALQRAETAEKLIGIQIGAVSFTDEGVEKVLDILQERAGVNALMLAAFTYGRGIAGRQVPGQPLPDHGVQAYDTNTFHGGDYAVVHPQYYRDSVFKDLRASDVGSFDILGDVIPRAKPRGIRSYCWFEDVYNPRYIAGFEQEAAEVDIYGRRTSSACLNNPHVLNFLASLAEDWIKSYDVDGIMWCSERQGPVDNAIGADAGGFTGRTAITCFCQYCCKKGKDRGIEIDRAREGLQALHQWVQSVVSGPRPADGCFVTFWRLLVDYPEILAWEKLWTDSQREVYAMLYGQVKSIRRDLPVGWHIWHNNSFSPFYRAEQNYVKFEGIADFLKVVMYNNCAGPRMAQYIRNVNSTVFGDLSPEQVLQFHYAVLGYKGEAPLDSLPQAGFTSRYVGEETRRALADVKGQIEIYPGIDIDIPTGPSLKKTTPEDVRDAVKAALSAGAQGVILSRKYSEMRLDHLGGAGQGLRDLGLWKA
ncbi:MAG TPA: hypothetical protein VGY31_10435 [Terriglobia bacterium]|nr:hypothetical protein [Terriglobia bacterium]